jgi:type 1 glutamine amidotransferase
VKVLSSHPVVANVPDFQITDELYYDVALASWTRPDVHAASRWEQRALPAVLTIDGRPHGPGRVAYVAPGGNMPAFVADPVRRIILNSIDWCLART